MHRVCESMARAMESPAQGDTQIRVPNPCRKAAMSPIQGVGDTSPIHKIVAQPIHKQLPAEPTTPSAPRSTVDKLELSGVSQLLKTLKSNDVRTDKVAQVRAQIEAGTYETDDKLDAAADKLLDELS